jgi:hypothetical protein
MKIRKILALANSPNSKTAKMHRQFIEDERRARNCQIDENSKFLDWKIYTEHNQRSISGNKGSNTTAVRACRACIKIQINVKTNDEGQLAVLLDNQIISNPKEIGKVLTKKCSEEANHKLIMLPMHGHSFEGLRNNADSNWFLHNPTSKFPDYLVKWAIKARTNNLSVGNVTRNTNSKCRFCQASGSNDTLAHRLNGCQHGKSAFNVRHEAIVNTTLKWTKKALPNLTQLHTNQAIHPTDMPPLDHPYNTLRPDIWFFNDGTLHIIEITVPYDNYIHPNRIHYANGESANPGQRTSHHEENQAESQSQENNEDQQQNDPFGSPRTLEERRINKERKYSDLASNCRRKYNLPVKLTIIVVSSLGTVPRKTTKAIGDILHLNRWEKHWMNRELAAAAIRTSHQIMNKDLGNLAPPVIHDENSTSDPEPASQADSEEEAGDPGREEHDSEAERDEQEPDSIREVEGNDM